MGRIFKYISGTWILALPLMLILSYANISMNDSEALCSIGFFMLCFVPLVILLMMVTLPALLIAYKLMHLLFRLPATTTERFVLLLFFIQVAVISNIAICMAITAWLLDEKLWEWPLFDIKNLWPVYAAAGLSALLRFKAFIQLTEDLKPVQHETDLV